MPKKTKGFPEEEAVLNAEPPHFPGCQQKLPALGPSPLKARHAPTATPTDAVQENAVSPEKTSTLLAEHRFVDLFFRTAKDLRVI